MVTLYIVLFAIIIIVIGKKVNDFCDIIKYAFIERNDYTRFDDKSELLYSFIDNLSIWNSDKKILELRIDVLRYRLKWNDSNRIVFDELYLIEKEIVEIGKKENKQFFIDRDKYLRDKEYQRAKRRCKLLKWKVWKQ